MKVLIVAACSLTLSFGAAIGINLQKLSMTNEERQSRKRPSYLQPLWCIGMVILVCDACGDFVFIGLAPQSLLAPLGALSLGFNIILAPIFHKNERVTRNILIATGLIYAGTILTVLFAADSSPAMNLATIVEFLCTKLFLGYAVLCIALQCSLVYHGYRQAAFQMVHYCGLAGSLGGETILFAKSVSELTKNALVTGQYDDWTSSALPYIFVLCMGVTLFSQVNMLNTGLSKFDALLVVPVYQSFLNAFGITGGLVFFQEYKLMSAWDGFMYAIGISITFLGGAVLVQERAIGKGHGSESSVETDQASPRNAGTIDEISSRNRTFSDDHDGIIRHRRPRTNTEDLKNVM